MKKLLVCLLLLMVFTIPATTGTTAAQNDVTISLWTHDGLYVEFFTARAEEWKQNYPDINFTFDFQLVPDAWTVVLANIAAGEAIPDLVGIGEHMFPRFMEGGVIEQTFVDLTDRIGAEREQFIEGRWTPYLYNGRIYGVESALSASAFYYQPAIFEAYDLEVPTTWDEYMAAGEVLAEHDIAISILTDDASGSFQLYFLQRGGQVFDEAGNFVFDEEPNRQIALDVLNFLREGLDKNIFFMSMGGDFWGPAPITAFREGRTAGIIMPDWYSEFVLKPQAEDMAGQWRIAPMPVWDDGQGYKTSVWGGTGFAIAQSSPNVDLVWDFLHYAYMTEENQVKRFTEISYYPTMLTAFDNPAIVDQPDSFYGGQKIGQVFAGVVDSVPVWYQSQFRAAYQDAIPPELNRFYNGEISAETFVDNVIAVVEDDIAFGS